MVFIWESSTRGVEYTVTVRLHILRLVNEVCVVPENIHTPPSQKFFSLNPSTPQKFQSRVILSFKNFAFETPPSPLEFPVTFLGVGMDIFIRPIIFRLSS